MPQKISFKHPDKKIELLMRVRKVGTNQVIRIKLGDEIIREIKKKHLTPSEMEKVIILSDAIKGKTGTLSVEVGDSND